MVCAEELNADNPRTQHGATLGFNMLATNKDSVKSLVYSLSFSKYHSVSLKVKFPTLLPPPVKA